MFSYMPQPAQMLSCLPDSSRKSISGGLCSQICATDKLAMPGDCSQRDTLIVISVPFWRLSHCVRHPKRRKEFFAQKIEEWTMEIIKENIPPNKDIFLNVIEPAWDQVRNPVVLYGSWQKWCSPWVGNKCVSEEGVKWDALADASSLLSQILQQYLAHLHWRLVFWACEGEALPYPYFQPCFHSLPFGIIGWILRGCWEMCLFSQLEVFHKAH